MSVKIDALYGNGAFDAHTISHECGPFEIAQVTQDKRENERIKVLTFCACCIEAI